MPHSLGRRNLLFGVVEASRTLWPSAFATAADQTAYSKDRWRAFDLIYGFVLREMESKGMPHLPALFDTTGLTEEQVEAMEQRSMRYAVAAMLLTNAYGTSPEALPEIMYQAEVLVPSGPDPETWHTPLTAQDQAVLYHAVRLVAEKIPLDLRTFFRTDSVPVAQRRLAFLRMYALIGADWRQQSEFARELTPAQRQGMVVFALMCYVPRDEWAHADFVALRDELLPVPEPDWWWLERGSS
jgi:hypothetical protein